MKTIGMLGGMSWESSAVYYRLLNRGVQDRLGGVASARAILHSFDFAEIMALQDSGGWAAADARMAQAAKGLETAGADFVVMCCNTMHCSTEAIEAAIAVPFLHIADPLGEAVGHAGIGRIGLLGSRHTMARCDVLLGRLKERYGLDVLVPEGADFDEVNRVVYEELVRGKFLGASRDFYRGAIARLVARGAQGIILGCTELPLLVKPEDCAVPLFDTTALHAEAAIDFALQ
jgi:aspartate racemase